MKVSVVYAALFAGAAIDGVAARYYAPPNHGKSCSVTTVTSVSTSTSIIRKTFRSVKTLCSSSTSSTSTAKSSTSTTSKSSSSTVVSTTSTSSTGTTSTSVPSGCVKVSAAIVGATQSCDKIGCFVVPGTTKNYYSCSHQPTPTGKTTAITSNPLTSTKPIPLGCSIASEGAAIVTTTTCDDIGCMAFPSTSYTTWFSCTGTASVQSQPSSTTSSTTSSPVPPITTTIPSGCSAVSIVVEGGYNTCDSIGCWVVLGTPHTYYSCTGTASVPNQTTPSSSKATQTPSTTQSTTPGTSISTTSSPVVSTPPATTPIPSGCSAVSVVAEGGSTTCDSIGCRVILGPTHTYYSCTGTATVETASSSTPPPESTTTMPPGTTSNPLTSITQVPSGCSKVSVMIDGGYTTCDTIGCRVVLGQPHTYYSCTGTATMPTDSSGTPLPSSTPAQSTGSTQSTNTPSTTQSTTPGTGTSSVPGSTNSSQSTGTPSTTQSTTPGTGTSSTPAPTTTTEPATSEPSPSSEATPTTDDGGYYRRHRRF
ncbi:hypothetical protein TWF694_008965 [Orbilia ellipsospora]|uniref:Uncharacterized protein n=1 Tax=Orbilia ellipsospora TaxID=2528407 RepID=A0AAV9XDG0_9PEZI